MKPITKHSCLHLLLDCLYNYYGLDLKFYTLGEFKMGILLKILMTVVTTLMLSQKEIQQIRNEIKAFKEEE